MIIKVSKAYQEVQSEICASLEKADGLARFEINKWEKDIGFGFTNVMKDGHKIERAGVNFSHVHGNMNPKMAKLLNQKASKYWATGISSIIHPKNPHAPITHMNVRYFKLDNGTEWFGGGIDLTPHYINREDASDFHKSLKVICDKYHPDFYPKFKDWADEYFYIPHRNETRGIGGIFFDRLQPNTEVTFEGLFQFTLELGRSYPEIYQRYLTSNSLKKFTSQEKEWQLLRRGRYVEFNLVYDRGTKFGLESGGNTESILISMPPEVKWEFQHQPSPHGPEQATLDSLKKGINWII